MNPLVFARTSTCLILGLMLVGTCGFIVVENWSVADALYMTLITMSTVGFGEVQSLTSVGRVYTSGLITLSVLMMTCWTAAITSFLVSGELNGSFRRKRLKRMIHSLKDHVIVAGGGIMAAAILNRLTQAKISVVIITNDKQQIEKLTRRYPQALIIEDDPTSELALADANALEASFLVAATDNDYDNLLITISGKSLGNRLKVIGCAGNNELSSRLFKVGADEIICPSVITGEHVADLISNSDPQQSKKPAHAAEMSFC